MKQPGFNGKYPAANAKESYQNNEAGPQVWENSWNSNARKISLGGPDFVPPLLSPKEISLSPRSHCGTEEAPPRTAETWPECGRWKMVGLEDTRLSFWTWPPFWGCVRSFLRGVTGASGIPPSGRMRFSSLVGWFFQVGFVHWGSRSLRRIIPAIWCRTGSWLITDKLDFYFSRNSHIPPWEKEHHHQKCL